jgi:hypothetical protein
MEPLQEQSAKLLNEVEELITQFVILPSEHAKTALALYAVHTWVIDAAHATPYLIILSAEKQSGKTRLVEVLTFAVREPCKTANASGPALFQIIALKKPTLFLDESDATFAARSDRTEDLRGILNAGNRPGAIAIRGGKDGDPREYPTFCAKVLTGIDTGKLPDTIIDRGIVIRMRRRTPTEQLPRFREHRVEQETEQLRHQLKAWGNDERISRLKEAEPKLPDELDGRASDGWELLFAIADEAGGDWPARAREAAIALNGFTEEDEPTSKGALLLMAAYRAFGDRERIPSNELRERINEDEDAPFGRWNDGRGLDALNLSELLRPYEIKPKQVRFGPKTLKGYTREMFLDAWERWLGIDPKQSTTAETSTVYRHADVSSVSSVSTFVPESTNGRFKGVDPLSGTNLETSETCETRTSSLTEVPF